MAIFVVLKGRLIQIFIVLKGRLIQIFIVLKGRLIQIVLVGRRGGDRGGTVIKVLCYKPEGRWFDPSWCHWNFSLT